jgi:hypothetical protein
MGSSDPLPAGFEIRFGSLNFQATGNGYLMRLTNREELRARRQAGSSRDTDTCQHGRCGSFGATAPPTLWPALATGAVGAPACCAHRLATRRAHRRDDSRPGGGALGLRTALPHQSARRYNGVCCLRRRQRSDTQGSPWPQGILAPPPATSRPKAPPTSCNPPLRTDTRSGTFPVSPTQ